MRSLLFIACLFFIGCTRLGPSILVGDYAANHQKGEDVIYVNPDGTYIHRFKGPDGKQMEQSGKWEYEQFQGDPLLTFYDFVHWSDGPTASKGIWPAAITRSFGRIRLVLDRDSDLYYAKVE